MPERHSENPQAPLSVLHAAALTKTYATGRGQLELFRALDLTVYQGEMVAIVGESGTGKSSLLHLLAALDTPTTGDVWYGDGASVPSPQPGVWWQVPRPADRSFHNESEPLSRTSVKQTRRPFVKGQSATSAKGDYQGQQTRKRSRP